MSDKNTAEEHLHAKEHKTWNLNTTLESIKTLKDK